MIFLDVRDRGRLASRACADSIARVVPEPAATIEWRAIGPLVLTSPASMADRAAVETAVAALR